MFIGGLNWETTDRKNHPLPYKHTPHSLCQPLSPHMGCSHLSGGGVNLDECALVINDNSRFNDNWLIMFAFFLNRIA